MPPARQGDVWRALRLRPRAIALIDGVFEAQPSVWHREILDALDAGVPVLGGASMGALRAAELCGLGMKGAGRIFRWYRDGIVIDDAEVALLHAGAEHAWRALTVPQVNVAFFDVSAQVHPCAAFRGEKRAYHVDSVPCPGPPCSGESRACRCLYSCRLGNYPVRLIEHQPSASPRARRSSSAASEQQDGPPAMKTALAAALLGTYRASAGSWRYSCSRS